MVIVAKEIIVDTSSHAIRLENGTDIYAYADKKKGLLLGQYYPEEYADYLFRGMQKKAIAGARAYALPASNYGPYA